MSYETMAMVARDIRTLYVNPDPFYLEIETATAHTVDGADALKRRVHAKNYRAGDDKRRVQLYSWLR